MLEMEKLSKETLERRLHWDVEMIGALEQRKDMLLKEVYSINNQLTVIQTDFLDLTRLLKEIE